MELKDYQQKALDQVKEYLEALAKERKDGNLKHASLDAWENLSLGRKYSERQNGLGKDLPNFCLKLPTGGGKTLLAVKAIDLVNTIYLKKKTGLVLWVVPTNQIYSQTIKNLRDRNHPYRQHLDIASGGRTMILERTEKFSPLDIRENLVVLILMLPAAARQNKETLRMFRDSGGFQEFFPDEDKVQEHEKMLEKFSNLDVFGNENGFWGRQVKSSLGNTLRILNPLIVLDEGQKAYSEIAQNTLRGFNPSMIIELSATPPDKSNILVDIRGVDLNREEMIKLDLHVVNKANPDWKVTLLESVNKRNILEEKAKNYDANTGNYIRPICIIQAERMGKDQRGGRFIHAEDAREHLTNIVGIPPEQVAVVSAEVKEIEGMDLLSRDCPIRYIITKYALQEGWDCPFAYVLSILTNPSSKNSLTQLVGRILRQPYARKTKVDELDESYVFTFQQRASNILADIQKGFEKEGIGDLQNCISSDEGLESGPITEKEYEVREKFRKVVKNIILPVFVTKNSGGWDKVNYETDIASRIDWNEVNLKPLGTLALSHEKTLDQESIVNISDDRNDFLRQKEIKKIRENGLDLDYTFLSKHLIDIVPNPWIAFEFGANTINMLLKKYDEDLILNNFVFIIEELRKHLQKEKDRLSKKVFVKILKEKKMRYLIIGKDVGYSFPKKIKAKSNSKPLLRNDYQPLQLNLFDFVPSEDFNEEEKKVAWYLEDQSKLFFWHRNRAKQDYAIQGWRKQKIYPDFIFSTKDRMGKDFEKVFVVETKGIFLKNEDTEYKQSVLDLCNEKAKEMDWNEFGLKFKDKEIDYKVVFGDEWQRRFNEMFT